MKNEKLAEAKVTEEKESFAKRLKLSIPVVQENSGDVQKAKKIKFSSQSGLVAKLKKSCMNGIFYVFR